MVLYYQKAKRIRGNSMEWNDGVFGETWLR